ncbi:glycosyltransferase [Deefgea salmonis]|uniref:Glycosyltransferase n=1 Tax=Deefgea salmonis TaxID=2875502 RepID=A0ABS8BN84_9NEIS|nr:glycosyltransferase [Deefgea salmonis]MCB5197190.1 glycosyltransferase [Deefgea salmonis]
MNRQLLMVAYQCGPDMGSVSQIGWEWYQGMAQRRPVTLITHARNQSALAAMGVSTENVHFIDTEWLAGPLYRFACRLFPGREHAIFLLSSLDYFLFDRLALRLARRLRDQGQDWGAVHVPTPVSSAAGTCLDQLALPLLRGPLNCGLGNPHGFESILQQESQWLNHGRRLGQWWSAWLERHSPLRITLTATQATRKALPFAQQIQSRMLLENGIDPRRFVATPYPLLATANNPLKILFVGRMLAVKGVEFLLQAVAKLVQHDGVPVELTLAGDGSKLADYRSQATALQIEANCQFLGNVPLAQVPALMQACHVFCLPSVRESGGAVLLEAMASARPVIAFNFGGPAELVTPDVGTLLDADSPNSLIEQLHIALLDCYRSPRRWLEMGLRGAERLHQPHSLGFTWPDKLDAAEQMYAELSEQLQPALELNPLARNA